MSGDRHARNPITFRPSPDLRDRLDAIAEKEGRPVRAVIRDAVEREVIIRESDLAALDREQTRAMMAFYGAKAGEEADRAHRYFQEVTAAYLDAVAACRPQED